MCIFGISFIFISPFISNCLDYNGYYSFIDLLQGYFILKGLRALDSLAYMHWKFTELAPKSLAFRKFVLVHSFKFESLSS